MLQLLDRLVWRGFGTRCSVLGFPVFITAHPDRLPLVGERLGAALGLLASTRPRWLQRLRTLVEAFEVGPLLSSAGGWLPRRKSIIIDDAFLCNPDQPLFQIASMVVHEGTHARIARRGIAYSEDTKVRIERACIHQQRLFLHELPPDPTRDWALAHLDDMTADAEELWSPARAEERTVRSLHDLGFSPRLVPVIMAVRRWLLPRRAV